MKKIGIIRCQQVAEICPGSADFKFAGQGQAAFAEYAPVEVVDLVSCGGCPGKKVVLKARQLVERGAEIIFMGSCIKKGTAVSYPCPYFEPMKAALQKELGPVPLVDWTH